MLATYFSIAWLAQAMAQKDQAKVVDFLTGGNSNVAHQDSQLVQSRFDWAQTWERNQFFQVLSGQPQGPVNPDNVPDLPAIDFDKTQIIAVWGGNARNVSGYNLVDKTFEKNDDVIWLAPQMMSAGAAVAQTRPYAFIQVTKQRNEIDVMLQVGVDGQGSPIWKRIANFPKRGA